MAKNVEKTKTMTIVSAKVMANASERLAMISPKIKGYKTRMSKANTRIYTC